MKHLILVLALLFAPSLVKAQACTDGVDCFCDQLCGAGHGYGTFNCGGQAVIWCEDWEATGEGAAPALADGTGDAFGAAGYARAGDTPGGIPGDDFCPDLRGTGGWRDEGTENSDCYHFVSDGNCDDGGATTECAFEDQAFGEKYDATYVHGIVGDATWFGSPQSSVGITYLFKYSANWTFSGSTSAMKNDELLQGPSVGETQGWPLGQNMGVIHAPGIGAAGQCRYACPTTPGQFPPDDPACAVDPLRTSASDYTISSGGFQTRTFALGETIFYPGNGIDVGPFAFFFDSKNNDPTRVQVERRHDSSPYETNIVDPADYSVDMGLRQVTLDVATLTGWTTVIRHLLPNCFDGMKPAEATRGFAACAQNVIGDPTVCTNTIGMGAFQQDMAGGDINALFSDGRWYCARARISGLNTTDMQYDLWLMGAGDTDESHLISITKMDGTQLGEFGELVTGWAFNPYKNDTYGGASRAYRYEDNFVVTNGVPLTCAEIGFSFGPPAPPVVTVGYPNGVALPTGTTNTSLVLSVDRSSTCRYAPTNSPYDAMSLTMDAKDGGLTHAVPSVSMSADPAVTTRYYGACRDAAGVASETQEWAFSASGNPPGAPAVLASAPYAGQVFAVEGPNLIAYLLTTSAATCRISYGISEAWADATPFQETGFSYHYHELDPIDPPADPNGEPLTLYWQCQYPGGGTDVFVGDVTIWQKGTGEYGGEEPILVRPLMPAGTQSAFTREVRLTSETDYAGTCRFSDDVDKPYGDMPYTFSADAFETFHAADRYPVDHASTYQLWARCSGLFGNESAGSKHTSITIAQKPFTSSTASARARRANPSPLRAAGVSRR